MKRANFENMSNADRAALFDIYKNIRSGKKYVDYFMGPRWPACSCVLVADNFKPYIHYSHYGSSAIEDNLESLYWLITEIFDTTPAGFVAIYKCWDRSKYDDDLLIEYKDGRSDLLPGTCDFSSYFIDNCIDNKSGQEELLTAIIDNTTGEVLYHE